MVIPEYNFDSVSEALERKEYESAFQMALPHAKAGNADAQVMVSLLYEHGFGVARDVLEAERWLLKAAEQNSAVAWNNLGTMYAMRHPELEHRCVNAQKCYERAKELGFACADPYPPHS
jgi:uncharacterized protein